MTEVKSKIEVDVARRVVYVLGEEFELYEETPEEEASFANDKYMNTDYYDCDYSG